MAYEFIPAPADQNAPATISSMSETPAGSPCAPIGTDATTMPCAPCGDPISLLQTSQLGFIPTPDRG